MSFGIRNAIARDPLGAFARYYREAKLQTAYVLLNVNFGHKAESGNSLEIANQRLQMCRSHETFDPSAAAIIAKQIDRDVSIVINAFKKANNK